MCYIFRVLFHNSVDFETPVVTLPINLKDSNSDMDNTHTHRDMHKTDEHHFGQMFQICSNDVKKR